MSSILDEYELNVEHFEEMVGTGASIRELQVIFNVSRSDLNHFCVDAYGLSLDLAFARIREFSYRKYLSIMRQHAEDRAVTSATDMVERYVWEKAKESTVKIVFSGNVDEEGEDDKIVDDKPEDEGTI